MTLFLWRHQYISSYSIWAYFEPALIVGFGWATLPNVHFCIIQLVVHSTMHQPIRPVYFGCNFYPRQIYTFVVHEPCHNKTLLSKNGSSPSGLVQSFKVPSPLFRWFKSSSPTAEIIARFNLCLDSFC